MKFDQSDFNKFLEEQKKDPENHPLNQISDWTVIIDD